MFLHWFSFALALGFVFLVINDKQAISGTLNPKRLQRRCVLIFCPTTLPSSPLLLSTKPPTTSVPPAPHPPTTIVPPTLQPPPPPTKLPPTPVPQTQPPPTNALPTSQPSTTTAPPIPQPPLPPTTSVPPTQPPPTNPLPTLQQSTTIAPSTPQPSPPPTKPPPAPTPSTPQPPPTAAPPTPQSSTTIAPPTQQPPLTKPSTTLVPPTLQPPTVQPTIVPSVTPTPTVPPAPGEVSCGISIEKMGCYKDNQKAPRPLPNYILTDRDRSLTIFSGYEIDWGDWVNYLPDLVCRCAELTKSKGFKFFGIQFYGECWSGPSQDENSFKEDGSSTDCVDTKYQSPCPDDTKEACAGKEFNNYVYAID